MILIDMDIPESCCECPMCHPKGKDEPWNYACFQGMMDINLNEWDKSRHPNCPIKCNIEDIKAEIDKQYKWLMQTKLTLNDIDIAFDAIKSIVDKHTSKAGKEQNG